MHNRNLRLPLYKGTTAQLVFALHHVLHCIKSKAKGFDGISIDVLKLCCIYLLHFLMHIVPLQKKLSESFSLSGLKRCCDMGFNIGKNKYN